MYTPRPLSLLLRGRRCTGAPAHVCGGATTARLATATGSCLWQRLQFADLLDQVGLLVVELLVLGPVRVEFRQEVNQLLLVPQQNVQDRLRLVRVGHKYLKKDIIYFKTN